MPRAVKKLPCTKCDGFGIRCNFYIYRAVGATLNGTCAILRSLQKDGWESWSVCRHDGAYTHLNLPEAKQVPACIQAVDFNATSELPKALRVWLLDTRWKHARVCETCKGKGRVAVATLVEEAMRKDG